jgi:radical SAM protein with 4Fe4S-binding SPASM domain
MLKPLLKRLTPHFVRLWLRALLLKLDVRFRYYYFLAKGCYPYPAAVCIDPINTCQLKCPLCPTGANRLNYKREMMSLGTFKIVIGKLPFIKKIDLFNWGEPFLNPDILEMVKYAHDRNIETRISTNFSFHKPDDFFTGIIESGLCTLLISLDGTSQESYSQYRIGGNLDTVISNIKKMTLFKERLQSSRPEIIWQFIVNRANEHEIKMARRMSDDLKVKLDLVPIGLSDDLPDVIFEGTIEERKSRWLPADKKYVRGCYRGEYRYPLSQTVCGQLFTYMVVNPDGKVFPCCFATDRENVFGDMLTESFPDIWNNEKYLQSRLLFLKKGFLPGAQTVCCNCNNFGKE